MDAMLKVEGINVYYGAIHAIKDVSFQVNEGEVVTLIGANGAGKSTILKTIAGLLTSHTGSIEFLGQRLGGTPAHKIITKGLALVPEGRQIFLQMSVEENLEMGAFTRPSSEFDDGIADVYQRFPRLKERRRQVAGTLSGGEQQMLAMGRALMSKPQPADAGRALHGSGPNPGGADLRHHPGAEPGTAPLSSWWSRMPRWPCLWPTGAMCWRQARSSPPAPARSCWRTRQ